MHEKILKEILSTNIIFVSPDTSLSETISIMVDKKISCILVIQNKKPVGIFTERDIVKSLHRDIPLDRYKIKDLMTKPVLTANINMNLYQAYDLLEKNKIRHLAIVDSNDEIVGVVTQTDIINALGTEYFLEIKEVSKIMSKNVITIKKESFIRDAITKMFNFSISCIVVEERKHPVGILTERDVARLSYKNKDISKIRVDEVMNYPVQTIPIDMAVYEAVKLMNQKKIRRLVVVEKDGRIAGLVTQYDIIKKFEREYIEHLKNIIYEKERMLDEIKEKMQKKIMLDHIKHQKLEALGILAGGIAHDFNNILTTILGNISLAQISTKTESERFKILSEAEQSVIRAKNLTRQLLTFAKGGAPVKKIVSISRLLKETVKFALSGSNVRCEFSIPNTLLPVECDEGQFGQVINNLITNAKEAMPDGGIVEIKAEDIRVEREKILPIPRGKYIKISIKDHGQGIPEKYLQKIFDPFLTTKSKKSGLGLAIAFSIIKNHKGYIDVESKLGVGTTFYIYLPACEKKIKIDEKEVDKIFKGTGRILLMDDEESIQVVGAQIIKYLGYEVEVVGDGIAAIESYKKAKESNKPFDVVILDLIIPGGMNGKETMEELIAIDPEIKAVVSSGYSNDPIMANFSEYGFTGIISKPFGVKEISQTLHDLMKKE